MVGDLRGQGDDLAGEVFRTRGGPRPAAPDRGGLSHLPRKAAAEHGYTLERWVLCIPASMDGPVLAMVAGLAVRAGGGQRRGHRIVGRDPAAGAVARPEAGHVRHHYYNPYRLDGQPGTPAAVTFPLPGAGRVRRQDAGLFFGRESNGLAAWPDVAAPGAAGGCWWYRACRRGKSSLLRAGVLPRLREAGLAVAPEAASWPCLMFTPGNSPVEELAVRIAPVAGADAAALRQRLAADPSGFALTARQAALAAARKRRGSQVPGQRRVALVVDQCEQLFTVCQSPQERQAFITALHAAATRQHGSGAGGTGGAGGAR